MQPVLVLELLAPDLRQHAGAQQLEVARLGDVVVGAGAEALDHRLAILDRRQHHDRNVAHDRALLDAPAGLPAADARHQQVEQHAVDRLDREQLERFLARARQHHLVAVGAQRVGELLQIGLAVVDREDLLAALRGSRCRGSAVCAPALRSMALSRARMTAMSSSLRTKASAPASSARTSAPRSSDAVSSRQGSRAQRRVEPDAPDHRRAVDAGQFAVDDDRGRAQVAAQGAGPPRRSRRPARGSRRPQAPP